MGGELEAGIILFNKYRVETAIGRGGFGAVYKAVDTRLGRVVAIKTLLYGQTSIDDRFGSGTFDVYLDRFKREAVVSSYFTSNKHIITVYGLEEDADSSYYLILEYLEGGSLADLLKKEGPLPVRRVCQIALDICNALSDIHQHPADIVHRDLKPSNILLRSNGAAVLADFGIAQVGQESHRTVIGDRPRHPGSPPYKSPEQSSNYDYLTPASDLYSLGLLMYEMLTARLYAKFKKLPPSQVNPQIPDWLDEIIIKLLKKDPDERYQQAEEVAEAIKEGLAQLVPNRELETQPLKSRARSAEKVAKPQASESEAALIARIEREAEEAEQRRQAEVALQAQREKEAREEAERQARLKREAEEEHKRQAALAWQSQQAERQVHEQRKKQTAELAFKALAERELRAMAEKESDEERRRKAENAPQIIYLLSQLTLAEGQNDWDKAIRQGERILELDSEHQQATFRTAAAYWQRGIAYYNRDDYRRALPDFNRAIQLNPNEVSYYFERSKSLIRNGDYEQAIADLTYAIRLDPNKVDYYYWRGVCYHNQRFFTGRGDYDWAIADYGRAIRIDPGNPDYFWRRGISYGCKGNYQQAITDYNKAIELRPRNGQYYYSRGLAYRSIVDREAAWRDFKRSAELGYADAKKELAKF